jgi:hypothetical protein
MKEGKFAALAIFPLLYIKRISLNPTSIATNPFCNNMISRAFP